MGVKRKVKHKDNVVNLFGDDVLWFVRGFEKLAERVDAPADALFMALVELSVNGLIEPVCFKKRKGGLELNFRVARDLREAWELKRRVVKREKLTPEEFERLKEIRDAILGPMPKNP